MNPEFLRPKDAAKHFGVSRTTLSEWADAGWIGRSRVDGCVFYAVNDIAELIASHATRRTVVSITSQPVAAAASATDWRNDPFWTGEALR